MSLVLIDARACPGRKKDRPEAAKCTSPKSPTKPLAEPQSWHLRYTISGKPVQNALASRAYLHLQTYGPSSKILEEKKHRSLEEIFLQLSIFAIANRSRKSRLQAPSTPIALSPIFNSTRVSPGFSATAGRQRHPWFALATATQTTPPPLQCKHWPIPAPLSPQSI